MIIRKKSWVLGVAGVLASIGLASTSASAGVVNLKPTPHGNAAFPEFGTTLARAGTFSLVGALQEHVKIAGEPEPTFPSTMQGAVYLFRGTNSAPERVYQFPGVAQHALNAGAQVAISNRFLAFATRSPFGTQSPYANSVFIARNTNGVWAECPTVNGQRNCNGAVRQNGERVSRALTRIPLTHAASDSFRDVVIAISDDYLAIGYHKHSLLEVYRYDATSDSWVRDLTLQEPSERFTGAAVAIEGDKIVVGSPWTDQRDVVGRELGNVRVFRRNASTGTWNATGGAYGFFSSGGFGKGLAISGANLVVRSGGPTPLGGGAPAEHLAFYRVGSDGSLSAPQSFQVATPHVFFSLSGDTFASTVGEQHEGLSVYKRDPASGRWRYETGLMRDFYQTVNSSGFGYGGNDPIALVGDDLVLGWRGFSNLLGGVIHEKVSLLDACRDPRNVVRNCSFDTVTNTSLSATQSGNGWQLLNHQGAAAWADYTGRQLRINVQNPGSDMWHVQARTTVNLAQSGTYTLTFRAKADNFRSFVVNLGRNGASDNRWTSYGRITATAGPEWVTYVFDLPNIPQDSGAFLDFNVGNAGTAAVTFDSVKLVRRAP